MEIDGIGNVELDASFRDKSPAEQQRIIEEIASQVGGSPEAPSRPKGGKRDITVTFTDGSAGRR